ncbi:MAG: arginine repressor [Pseudomonadota bacterium]|nr:arginine repressor [Pseudomonadota bacterium]
MALTDSRERQKVLSKLLAGGRMSTQEELVEELSRLKFDVTQSTISRDLRRIGAVKAVDANGATIYRLGTTALPPALLTSSSLRSLLVDITHNDSLIVMRTVAGSASLVAAHLDNNRPEGILGTIAGDDTIFVAPSSTSAIKKTIKTIYESLL